MRTICLLAAAALLLAACATAPQLKAGGQHDGRYTKGTAGIGIPF
jgi:opacity protein-like surface antigen